MENSIKKQAQSINVKIYIFFLVMSQVFIGCSSKTENHAIVPTVFNLNGIYRSLSTLGDVESLTALEITRATEEKEVNVRIFKNGLSSKELGYFNSINLVSWGDDKFGREVNFSYDKEGVEKRSFIKEEVALLEVCAKKRVHQDTSQEFLYCLKMERDVQSLEARVVLNLSVFLRGELQEEIKTLYTVFLQDRWGVDYFGNWQGEVSFEHGNRRELKLETGQNLFLTFQPITEQEFILRPRDLNQTIYLANERFVLFPDDRPISDLEGNANPYINFIYISSQNGSRRIFFNSYVRSSDFIEGNILLRDENQNQEILGYYELEKVVK